MGAAVSSRLDNPVWWSLQGAHRPVAESCGVAQRYLPDVSMFAAVDRLDSAAWQALAAQAGSDGAIVLFRESVPTPPTWLTEVFRVQCDQMIAPAEGPVPDGPPTVVLGADHAAEMGELLSAGDLPWRPRTHELGRYVGVLAEDGSLRAMAGERFAPGGAVEISAVATRQSEQRAGLAAYLTLAVAAEIRGRGCIPFLHVSHGNDPALALYRKLGFTVRRQVDVVGIVQTDPAAGLRSER